MEFPVPGYGPVSMTVREGTNDENICRSILVEDEYRIRPLRLAGTALDIGAHIGAASVLLAVLNPELRIIAVEPIPPNLDLLRENIDRNRIADRVEVLDGAAGRGKVRVAWNWRGDPSAVHHRFIGNQHFSSGTPHDTVTVRGYTLRQLVWLAGGAVSFLKIDAEGAERTWLRGPALRRVGIIAGEWHDGPEVGLRFTTGEALA
jgi:FkbM family methyltransferase